MTGSNKQRTPSPKFHSLRSSTLLPSLSLLLLLGHIAAQAQLPAGTRDASQTPVTESDPLRTQAAAALDQRDYPTALKLLTALVDKAPTDAHLLYDLASTQDALEQTSNAEATYRRAIAADPDFFEPRLALGFLLARNQRPADARTELNASVSLPKADPALKALALRALARLDQTAHPPNIAAARDHLLAALKLSPETPDDILLSSDLAQQAGDLPAAESAAQRLLASQPQNPAAIASLGHILILQNKAPEAEALLAPALAQHPDNGALTAQLAAAYAAQDTPDKQAQAVALVEKLHSASPSDSSISRLLARLYSRNGQYDKAEALYATLVATTPGDPVLLDDRADALIHLGRYTDAEALLKRAVAEPAAFPSPDDLASAASHLAFASSQNNDPATTLRALEIRAKLQPQSPSTLFLSATAYDKLHQVRQASDLYKQFLSVANGKFPNEEWEARHRLLSLEHTK